MARTRKDRRAPDLLSNVKQKPKRTFKRRYMQVKRNGFEDPGDYCPDCGEPTGFQSGFLVCPACGWIDSGPDAIEVFFSAA